jgi:hypothetical protein
LARLKGFDQLPKQLMRLVLRSSDLSYTTSPSLFAAMIAEWDEQNDGDLPIAPSQWHQRTMQLLFVKDHEDGICVDIGPVEKGVKYAFGPIRDRRQAQDFLTHLGASLNGKMTRRGLVLPADAERTLLDYFNGSLDSEASDLEQKKRSIRLWFQPKERKQITARLETLQKLLSFPRPKWEDILSRQGAVVVPGDDDRTWSVYSIVGTMPVSCRVLNGSADVVRDFLYGSELSAQLRGHRVGTASRPLTSDEANRVNGTIWWMYSVRGESRFIPLRELENKKS